MKLSSRVVLLLFLVLTGISFSCNKVEPAPPGGGSIDPVAKFLGTWHVNEPKSGLNYEVDISRHVIYPKTKVHLSNFANLGGTIEGDVVGNTILITNEQPGDPDYTVKDGTGTFVNANRLDFTFTLDDGIETDVRDAVFTK